MAVSKDVIKWQAFPVSSLSELIDECENLREDAGPAALWFRGHSDSTWKLRPKAYRSFPDDDFSSGIQEDALFVEREMAWNFISGAPSRYEGCPATNEFARWLTLMQHYGLHTRLLDWTASASVATYFAVNPTSDHAEGVVWVLRPSVLNTYMLRQFGIDFPYGYNGKLFLDDTTKPVRELTRPVFLGDELGNGSVLAAVPQEHDRRVTVQQSMFTVHGSTCPLDQTSPQLWGELPQNLLARIVIPALAKADFRKSLSLLGVSRASLFPDLDNLAQHINETQKETSERLT